MNASAHRRCRPNGVRRTRGACRAVRSTRSDAPYSLKYLTTLATAGLFLTVAAVALTAEADNRADVPEPVGDYERAVLIPVEGTIGPMLRAFVFRKLEEAKQSKADLVILRITSPGGLVDESERLARHMREIDWARTVAFVPESALSGATIMALGCDDIVMAPDAKLGDAGPIFLDEDFMFRHAPEKFRSDLVRTMRDLAEQGGRPPALAEAMADTSTVVHRYRHRDTGEVAYLSAADIEGLDDAGAWEKGPLVPESREGLFLTVNGRRAAELGLADATVSLGKPGPSDDLDALKQRYGIDDRLTILNHSTLDTLVTVLNWSIITWLLFVVGMIALYVELSAPGIGFGGLTAGLCFGLFFWSRFLGGTAGWLELVLFIAGVAFLLIELLVFPGFGLAGITGILLLLVGLLLAGQSSGIPDTRTEMGMLANSILVLASSMVAVGVAVYFLGHRFGMVPLVGQLMLRPPDADRAPAAAEPAPPRDGRSDASSDGAPASAVGQPGPLVGDRGIAHTALRPAGKGRFGDRFVNVVTDSEFIARGAAIEVVEIDGRQFHVRPV